MFSPVYSPFLVPETASLIAQPWQLVNADEVSALPPFLNSWSQGTSLRVRRTVEVDRERVFSETLLPPETELAISVVWKSDATNMQRKLRRIPVGDGSIDIDVLLPGDEISGRITLFTSLILNNSVRGGPDWVANVPGAILLRDSYSVTLEGDAAVFPMSVVDFASTRYPTDASWYLESTTDLEARFSSAFLVQVNERDKKLVKAVESLNPTPAQTAYLENLTGEIIATVLHFAYTLRAQGALPLEGHEEGSVGEVLAGFIKRTNDRAIDFSDDPVVLVQQRSLFEAMARELGAGRRFQ